MASQSQAIRLVPEPVRTLGFAAIGGAYMGVGTQIDNPARILRIQNLTNVTLFFSFDGVNDHEVLASNSFLLLDITANKARDHGYYLAEGTRIYVREGAIAPGNGDVYVTVYYGANE